MRVSIAGRHLDITDALKSHVESRLVKVRNHFDKVIDADVVLSVEKHRHIAEITLHANGVRIHGRESSPDMYISVDTVVDKIDRQIKKFNDRQRRFQARKGKAVIAQFEAEALEEESAVHEPETIRVGDHILVREPIALKPMSAVEAALQLELANETFLVFVNADTQKVNVVYSKDNATFGLIEPEH